LPAAQAGAAAAPETTAVVMGADGRPLLVHGATGATIGVDRAGNPVVVREPILSGALPDPAGQAGTAGSGAPTDMVTLRSVRGQVHASLLTGVAEAIEASPEDAVRVVRAWLHEG
jgi:hypothetical protein